nr:hypothetical protein [Micromonospora sp. DSM 115978]
MAILVAHARVRLRDGAPPGRVFSQLAAAHDDLRVVARVVRLAAGGDRDETERLLREHHATFAAARPGDEEALGAALESVGFWVIVPCPGAGR